jgi:hypothetical protein
VYKDLQDRPKRMNFLCEDIKGDKSGIQLRGQRFKDIVEI